MDHDEADDKRENRNQNCCDSTASQGENETDENESCSTPASRFQEPNFTPEPLGSVSQKQIVIKERDAAGHLAVPSLRVVRVLDRLRLERGLPERIVIRVSSAGNDRSRTMKSRPWQTSLGGSGQFFRQQVRHSNML